MAPSGGAIKVVHCGSGVPLLVQAARSGPTAGAAEGRRREPIRQARRGDGLCDMKEVAPTDG